MGLVKKGTEVAKEMAQGVQVVSFNQFGVAGEEGSAGVGHIPLVKHGHVGEGSALAKVGKGVVKSGHGGWLAVGWCVEGVVDGRLKADSVNREEFAWVLIGLKTQDNVGYL